MKHARLRISAPIALLVAMMLLWYASANAQDSVKVDPSKLMPPPPAVPLSVLKTKVDSVTAAPGEDYSAWFLHRFMWGDLNRDVWAIKFRVPVLNLDSVGGGLTMTELSGRKQTMGMQFAGEDGLAYQFRSIVKEPRRMMPGMLHQLPPGLVSKDQMAAQFPLGSMIVAELVEAVGVLVAKPRPVVMPDDPRLGEYREAFAGRMGWIETRPVEREGELPGFAGSTKITSTYDLYEELIKNPQSYVNAPALLKARLVDFLVGDWDRHSDQWRWARFKDGDRFRWDPIPRDRDWAFPRIDGFFLPFLSLYLPQYLTFSSKYPDISRLSWASQRLDRFLLANLDRSQFMAIANEVSAKLSDAVLAKSVAVLPPEYREAGNSLLGDMRARRDALVRLAGDFYALLARDASIVATDKADSVTITSAGDSVRVQVHEGAADGKGLRRYDRTFRADETDEVRIYLLDGDDRVAITGSAELPITLRIATGDGDDRVVDSTSGDNVHVYNSDGRDDLKLGDEAFRTNNNYLTQDTLRTAAQKWNVRDWGSTWMLLPALDHQSDVGMLVGAKLTRNSFGFGQQPCHTCASLQLLGALRSQQAIAMLELDRMITPGGWFFANSVEVQSGRPTRFYGFGNEVPLASGEFSFTGFRETLDIKSGLRYEPSDKWNLFAGVAFKQQGAIREGGEIFETISYGGDWFQQVGLRSELEIDTRDNKGIPNSGGVVRLSADYHPSLLEVESPFASVRGTIRWYRSLPLPFDPALHLRVVGAKVWGTTPFAEIPYLGGSSTLPGFARSQFRGDAMAAGSALLRAKAFSLMKLDFGVHGLTSIGRVWLAGEESSTWHTSNGAGVWLGLSSGRAISVTFAEGSKQRMYFDFGFIF